MRGGISVILVAALSLLVGCGARQKASEALPVYDRLDDAAALRVLAERARAVKTVSARCNLTLVRPDGQSVELDGAVAMAPPGRMRLRAWKFGQAVFDLTLTPDGLWVVTPDDPGRKEKVLPASVSAAQLGREWAMLDGGFFDSADLSTRDERGKLVVGRALGDGRTLVCYVDRLTLTPRLYRMLDPAGNVRFALAMLDYEVVNGLAWPTRLAAGSAQGRILIRMKDVELNGELPANAFKAPRRAEKVG